MGLTQRGIIMVKNKILKSIKQSFKKSTPKKDSRTKISHLNFVSALVFCFQGDSKSFSLESIRRFMNSALKENIAKSSFWERLSRNRLRTIMKKLIGVLISDLSVQMALNKEILKQLGVSGIEAIDSSSITLWDGAKGLFPGTRTYAGIKWHACFDLLSGRLTWFDTTATKVHDRKCFPDFNSLAKKLIIFDLGYWDYGLLISIEMAKGFFLSRVKLNSAIVIKHVVSGISRAHTGCKLSSLTFKRKSKDIVELLVDITVKGITKEFRVIGFWNPTKKQYHWYITNLNAPANIISTLYKIRWQLELIFKGSKRSFNLDKRPKSNNQNIIESVILSSVVAALASHVVLHVGAKELSSKEKEAISFQRVCFVTAQIAKEFVHFLTRGSAFYLTELKDQIKNLSMELYEKNFS
jgi:hypothetical protein